MYRGLVRRLVQVQHGHHGHVFAGGQLDERSQHTPQVGVLVGIDFAQVGGDGVDDDQPAIRDLTDQLFKVPQILF